MSTVGEVKTALRVLFEDTFDPADVRTTFGNRVTVTTSAARLAIGNVIGRVEPESLGAQRSVTEEYDVACEISVTWNGSADDQEAVTLACLALFEGAEHAVRSSPGQNLGVADVLWAGVTGDFRLTESPASETKGPINAVAGFNVHVKAMYRLS